MKQISPFKEFWQKYHDKTLKERERYFTSLPDFDRKTLIKSFFSEGWHQLFIRNIIDDNLDFLKETYDIDLIDMRIKSLKQGRVFLIEKRTWEHALELLEPYGDYCDMSLFFGGLSITPWGKQKQFYRIGALLQRRTNVHKEEGS